MYICEKCAKKNKTCCSVEHGKDVSYFPLSEEEIERLETVAGPREKYITKKKNTAAFLLQMNRLFPKNAKDINTLFPVDGEHNHLLVDDSGSCLFLTDKGCSLERENRPYYCNLYPLWLVFGELCSFSNPNCLAIAQSEKNDDDVEKLLEVFHKDIAQVEEEFDKILLAWDIEKKINLW